MRIVTVVTAVSDIVRRRRLKNPQRFGCWTCRRFQVEIVAGEPVMGLLYNHDARCTVLRQLRLAFRDKLLLYLDWDDTDDQALRTVTTSQTTAVSCLSETSKFRTLMVAAKCRLSGDVT